MSNPTIPTDQPQYIFNKVFHPTAQALVTTPVDATGSPITSYPVTATNLDIRDLTSASDSVEVKQATGTNLHAVLDAGTAAIGKLAANSGVDIGDVDVTSIPGTGVEDAGETAGGTLLMAGSVRRDTAASSAGTTGDNATINTSAEGGLWSTLTPTTTSGCDTFRSIDLDETEEDVKTSAGNVYGYYFFNAATSVRYLKFYNATAANTTVGSTTPKLTLPLPAGSAANVSFPCPVSFSTAICAAATTGVADSDTGAPAANDVVVNILYK